MHVVFHCSNKSYRKKKSNEVFKLRYGYLGNINIMTYYEVMLKIIVKIKQWKTLNENININ